jgi:hypothetical protein
MQILRGRAKNRLEGAFRRSRRITKLACTALTVLMLAATVLAGSRYFYCPSMDESQFTSCCAEQMNEGAAQGAPYIARACCESKVMRGLPSGHVDAPRLVLAAPFVAIVSIVPACEPATPIARSVGSRWGSDPPTASEVRSRLMVFLT